MTVIQKASHEQMFRAVHKAMYPQDLAHVYMNDAVRFVRGAEVLGLIKFDSPSTENEKMATAVSQAFSFDTTALEMDLFRAKLAAVGLQISPVVSEDGGRDDADRR